VLNDFYTVLLKSDFVYIILFIGLRLS